MNSKQYYSCDRNHYFFGKLMTVRDFESEQIYFNAKRHIGNRMLSGTGIVSGLDVILVDNRTISLEPGMAIDYMGREIIVPESNVKRLSVIDGFEEGEEPKDMYLCIRYKEELKESTFSIAGSAKDSGVSQEFNRVHEGYELFLTEKEPEQNLGLNFLAYNNVEVYNKNGIKITLIVPKYVNPKSKVKVTVMLEKLNVAAQVKYKFSLNGEFFKSEENGSPLNIEYQEDEVSLYKCVKRDYYLSCDAVSEAFTDVVLDKDSFKLDIGSDSYQLEESVKQLVEITTDSIKDVVIKNYYEQHFDDIVEVKEGQEIYLAKLHVVSNQAAYFIEDFQKHPFNQYLLNNELLGLLQTLDNNSKISENGNKVEPNYQAQAQATVVAPVNATEIITGVERINLGFYAKVGKPYYSCEFIHGLGHGNIGVVTAVENKESYVTNEESVLVFGDDSVFKSEEVMLSCPNMQVGALVNPSKGTMKLGIKLAEKTNAQFVDIRWWAFKTSNKDQKEEQILNSGDINVVVTPNTTKVEPMGQIRFSAKVEGTNNQEVRWSLAEDGSGTIDNNGLYTAPSKEGVYEVIAQSVGFEDKNDSAYVVVSVE